jgi:hypothetical protein
VDFLEAQVTNTQLVYYPPICDPWWGWCVPGGVGPGTVIVGKDKTNEFAWSAGLGVDFELGGGSKLYLEAKWHSVETPRASTEFVPFVIGFRF